jgi:hypothetical protein
MDDTKAVSDDWIPLARPPGSAGIVTGRLNWHSLGGDGTAHLSGIHGVGNGERNITRYALDRLDGL